jgi:hypothetical protein
MNDTAGLGLRRAWRLLGVFAPLTILVTVPVAVVSVATSPWMLWVACTTFSVTVAVAGWVIARGEPSLVRLGAAVTGVAISGLVVILAFWGFQPILAVLTGEAQAILMYALIGAPWVVLVVGGTLAARAGRYPGAARVTIWWILALGMAGLSVPAIALMASLGIGDDMSMLVLFFIPPAAMCMWLGPAVLVGCVALARGSMATADAPGDPSPAVAGALEGGIS